MALAAIGTEVDRVLMPHGKRIGVLRVRKIKTAVVFQIVNRDGLRQSAAIALPGAEVAEDHVVCELGAVRGVRGEPALLHWERLRKTTVDTDAELALDPSVLRIAPREEHYALAVGRPGNDFIVDSHAVAQRLSAALIEGQLFRLSALGRHDVNIKITVVLPGE